MKRILLLSFMSLTMAFGALAQRTVSGKVTSAEDGSGIPGVNVVLKGTTTGTTSDLDGNYRLSVPEEGGVLVFSFVGLEPQESEIGARSVIDAAMASDVKQLTEVVVTAYGPNRNARDVSYANQTVNGDDLLSTPNKNALEALRGKTAGVKLTTGSGSVGASTRVVLRGEASLTGNNNALIVIDGIPIDNTISTGGAVAGEAGFSDYGNRFNDFDPNNIASVTILKGPSATSLYGSRGASGVVLITTKSGTKDKLKVNVSSTASVEQAYVLLKRQDQYGQGLINPDGSTNFDSGENFSWGPKFDGVVRPWTSPVDADGNGTTEYLSRPYSPVKDQLQNFFQLGSTFSNSLSLSGGDNRIQYYASYANTLQKGVMDNTDYTRHNVTVKTTAKLSDKVSSQVNISYANVEINTTQEGSRAFEGQNPYASAVQAPTNIPYDQLRDYKSPFHDFNGYYGSYTVNPYFILNEYKNNGKTNNWLGSLSMTYNPIASLSLTTKMGANYSSLDRVETVPTYQYADHFIWSDNLTLVNRGGRQNNAGNYNQLLRNVLTIDWTSTANYTMKLGAQGNSSLSVLGGLNYFDITTRQLFGQSNGGLVVPGVYNLANSVSRSTVTQGHNDKRIIGLFGNVSYSWNNKVFLDYSARNDWSSTLPVNNQSFFYQALGTSVIVSDFLGWSKSSPIMNYWKFRTSIGTTGKDAGLYLLNSTYTVNPTLVDYGDIYQVNTPLGGQTGITKNGQIGNNNLTPEITTTFEIGSDFTLLKGKVQLAYTYYHSDHNDQIVSVELPRSSGYTTTAKNLGEVTNQGHEATLTLLPVTLSNGFEWEVNLSYARNRNKVVKISDQADELTIYSTGRGVTLVAEEGKPFGIWKGQVARRTPTGEVIVDANGSIDYGDEAVAIGSVQPDWIGSVYNTFRFKGLSLGFLLDTRQGGSFYSNTKSATEFNGTAITTLWGDRKPTVIPNSVVENGDGTFSPNTQTILADAYLFDGNYGKMVLDGSFIKLREVTLGYKIPKSVTETLKLQNASVSVFAKNLKFWLPKENSFADPETIGPASNAGNGVNVVGVESTQTPPSRSIGVNLNLTF